MADVNDDDGDHGEQYCWDYNDGANSDSTTQLSLGNSNMKVQANDEEEVTEELLYGMYSYVFIFKSYVLSIFLRHIIPPPPFLLRWG